MDFNQTVEIPKLDLGQNSESAFVRTLARLRDPKLSSFEYFGKTIRNLRQVFDLRCQWDRDYFKDRGQIRIYNFCTNSKEVPYFEMAQIKLLHTCELVIKLAQEMGFKVTLSPGNPRLLVDKPEFVHDEKHHRWQTNFR